MADENLVCVLLYSAICLVQHPKFKRRSGWVKNTHRTQTFDWDKELGKCNKICCPNLPVCSTCLLDNANSESFNKINLQHFPCSNVILFLLKTSFSLTNKVILIFYTSREKKSKIDGLCVWMWFDFIQTQLHFESVWSFTVCLLLRFVIIYYQSYHSLKIPLGKILRTMAPLSKGRTKGTRLVMNCIIVIECHHTTCTICPFRFFSTTPLLNDDNSF